MPLFDILGVTAINMYIVFIGLCFLDRETMDSLEWVFDRELHHNHFLKRVLVIQQPFGSGERT